jgi:hypothetical protein
MTIASRIVAHKRTTLAILPGLGRLLAPYIAVGVFWCWLANGWLAILAYHIQILLWTRISDWKAICQPIQRTTCLLLALPCMTAGPVLYLLFPIITRQDLSTWLASHQLTGSAFLLMIPYFGLLHPVLEQMHWQNLRRHSALSHFAFAGYHMLVLATLLGKAWLLVCFLVLLAASLIWKHMDEACAGLRAVITTHILVDLGIVLAAWAYLR